jgi:hypothetical protein
MRHIVAGGFNKPQSTMYNKFKGVDFATDPAGISRDRSPYAPNMISDAGSTPEKRLGWRELITFPAEIVNGQSTLMPVNGLFACYIGSTSSTHYVVHVGTILYKVLSWESGTYGTLATGVNNAKSTSVYANGKLYIFTGREYYVYDGVTCDLVVGKTPQITIGRSATGGGTAFEAINLLSDATTDSFYITKAVFEGEGETPAVKTFFSSFENLHGLVSPANRVQVHIQYAGGGWATHYEGDLWTDDTTPLFTVDRTAGSVTFSDVWHAALIAGEFINYVEGVDNIRITVYKQRSGDADKIKKATIATQYNGFIFCAGAERGVDYRSGFDDPTYFPADGYDTVGTTNTDIVGYLRVGKYLAIVKEDNDMDATVFFRYDSTLSDGSIVFYREQAMTGIGAIAPRSFATLQGDPMFLSREGVFSIISNDLTDERIAANRSGYVDPVLTVEENLQNACAAVWRGWYVLVVNDRAYILDATQNKAYNQDRSSMLYECFHWTNIPARCLLSIDGELYFGHFAAKVCKFNTDIEDSTKYADTIFTEAAAIDASWSTKIDDDGNFAEKKSLMRAGTALLAKPFTSSSVEILIRSEREFPRVASVAMGYFDFNDVIFDNFEFNTLDTPQVIPFRTSSRKYHTLQITVRNAVVNQGFGVYGIVKRYYGCGVIR